MKTYGAFTDYDAHEVQITPSSLATQPAVRMYIKREAGPHGNEVDACLHLTKPRAEMVIAALQEWVNDWEAE